MSHPHPLRIVFIGTPDFAVASLKAMVEAGYNIVGVITAPDKPAGRGMQLQHSAVKKYALSQGLHLLQPVNLKNSEFVEELRSLKADLQVVIAFRMLPEVVWNMPPLGTFNLHASLLPQYRGAAPINWAIINGEQETGVTTFFLKHEIDTGKLLLQEKVALDDTITAGELHDELMHKGAQLVLRSLQIIENGTYTTNEQELLPGAKHAPKIFTEHCLINWNTTAEQVHNLIRGLSPYPAAFTHLGSKVLKVYRSSKELKEVSAAPGTIESDGKTFIKIAVQDGFVYLHELQLEGKKRMKADEFLRGFPIQNFTTLTTNN
ncbi:MAG: methionyl-tRNA formyltransferase [Bacteroidia bacterium]